MNVQVAPLYYMSWLSCVRLVESMDLTLMNKVEMRNIIVEKIHDNSDGDMTS